MTSPFPQKEIEVRVDARTWASRPVPTALTKASGTHTIDVGTALHMLGTLTMPNLLSPASPALFWAWLRYYVALAATRDLRITMDFADLDPHQKGILSDDFGVAIATKWLHDRFGGFRDFVDGRRFILQFPNLLRQQPRSTAKVGPNKCPDFVMRDKAGKWHVLECKGTQVRSYQNASLRAALQQKHALQLIGSVRGEQLASALFIANEESDAPTHLKIVDPEDSKPILTLSGRQATGMAEKAQRLSVARALGMIGLGELATELTLPASITPDMEFLRPAEVQRVSHPKEDRYRRAFAQVDERPLISFSSRGSEYRGREVRFELPPTNGRVPFRFARIRQGVFASVLDQVLSLASTPGKLDEQKIAIQSDSGIVTESDSEHSILRYEDLMFSEIIWEK